MTTLSYYPNVPDIQGVSTIFAAVTDVWGNVEASKNKVCTFDISILFAELTKKIDLMTLHQEQKGIKVLIRGVGKENSIKAMGVVKTENGR